MPMLAVINEILDIDMQPMRQANRPNLSSLFFHFFSPSHQHLFYNTGTAISNRIPCGRGTSMQT